MPDDPTTDQSEFREALRAHERQQRINTGKVASLLVVVLMPAGVLLDYFVYPDELVPFLALRLICAALAATLWYVHTTALGQKYYRLLALPIALLPAFFIAVMIFVKEGPESPYYAGLNLILLAVSAVGRYNMVESLLMAGAVLGMYLIACIARQGPIQNWGIFANNVYFLALTGIIV